MGGTTFLTKPLVISQKTTFLTKPLVISQKYRPDESAKGRNSHPALFYPDIEAKLLQISRF